MTKGRSGNQCRAVPDRRAWRGRHGSPAPTTPSGDKGQPPAVFSATGDTVSQPQSSAQGAFSAPLSPRRWPWAAASCLPTNPFSLHSRAVSGGSLSPVTAGSRSAAGLRTTGSWEGSSRQKGGSPRPGFSRVLNELLTTLARLPSQLETTLTTWAVGRAPFESPCSPPRGSAHGLGPGRLQTTTGAAALSGASCSPQGILAPSA